LEIASVLEPKFEDLRLKCYILVGDSKITVEEGDLAPIYPLRIMDRGRCLIT
jgi:hypothetical protein